MKTAVKNKQYEAMFLVDAAEADADWQSVESSVRKILERVDAEIISLRKWDTRRLAYDVGRKSRGTYILCYFRADGKRIAEIERTVQLSEQIMRALILSADHITQDAIEKDTPAILTERPEGAVGEKAGEVVAAETKAEPARDGEASGPEDTGAQKDSGAAAVAVSEETAGESEGGGEPAEGRKRGSKAGEAASEVSEPEQSAGDKPAGNSESAEAEGSDQEKSEEAGQ
ncbi:MAG: 30S ribosomal protein S6 [Planctomycetota bacterium]